MTSPERCDCELDGWTYQCIDGEVYGPCGDDYCGGSCEPEGPCSHACHAQREVQS